MIFGRILSLAFLAAGVAAAQPAADTPPTTLSQQNRPGIAAGSVLDLSLEDMILMLLQNDPGIEASRLDLQTADYNVIAAQGVYDPVFAWDTHYDKRATPVSSPFGGAANGRLDETALSASPTVSGLTPWGATWSVGSVGQKQTSTNAFVPLNPQYVAGMTFTFTAPLVRGREIDFARRGVRVASRNRDISGEGFRQRVINQVAAAVKTYFDLVAAQENLEIQRRAYEQAQRSLESNQRLAAQGLLANGDVVSARARMASYETAWDSAQDQLAAVENALKAMLLPSKGSPLWRAWLRPTSTVDAGEQRLRDAGVPVDEAIETALRLRPEMAQIRSLTQISEINAQYFANQAKPQVDLYGSYAAQGLAGTVADRGSALSFFGPTTVPPGLVGGLGGGYLSILRANYPSFEAGVKISIPIRNRTAQANLGLAEVDLRRVRNQTNQTEQAIVAEVRNAAQALASARNRLAAASAGRDAAQLDYEGEQRKLQVGLTSVFEMFVKQSDLVVAQGRELQARTDLRKAVVEMERSMGRTLEVYHVDVDKAAAPSQSRTVR
jgi:outer membrane protein TolC